LPRQPLRWARCLHARRRSRITADGSSFIVAFYPYDKRAHIQLDGGAVTLAKRPTLSGARYSATDVTLKLTKDGAATLKHARRPATVCSAI
jgi:hypothetical protein